MNSLLRDRILRRLETLSDERGYQVLDYVEFLESRYAERAAPGANVFQRFAEGVEDRLRAGKVSAQTISQAMGLLNQAVGVLGGVAAAGKSVANDIVSAASNTASYVASSVTPVTPGTPPSGGTASVPPTTPGAAPPPSDQPPPPEGSKQP
jgi:hypothetical protein